jgi:hypothetical protein
MNKVLVERPRLGGWGVRKGRRARDLDALPGFQGMRRAIRESGNWKSLNENLSPLRRFLERQVGRPWNKVHSEIRAGINPRNEVQAHVLTHIDQFLHQHVERVEPSQTAPCGLRYRPSWIGRLLSVDPGELYVDPDDGIIKRARRKVAATDPVEKPAGPRVHRLSGKRLAIEVERCWYAVELLAYHVVATPTAELKTGAALAFDVAGRRHMEWPDPILGPVWPHDAEKLHRIADLYGPGRLATNKRQLSRRELVRHSLHNSPAV